MKLSKLFCMATKQYAKDQIGPEKTYACCDNNCFNKCMESSMCCRILEVVCCPTAADNIISARRAALTHSYTKYDKKAGKFMGLCYPSDIFCPCGCCCICDCCREITSSQSEYYNRKRKEELAPSPMQMSRENTGKQQLAIEQAAKNSGQSAQGQVYPNQQSSYPKNVTKKNLPPLPPGQEYVLYKGEWVPMYVENSVVSDAVVLAKMGAKGVVKTGKYINKHMDKIETVQAIANSG